MKKGERELLVGAVALLPGRVRDDGKAMLEVCDTLEPSFQEGEFLRGAPFDVISLIIRYGEYSKAVSIGKVNRHKELEARIETSVAEVSSLPYEDLRKKIMLLTLESLIDIGNSYGLDVKQWEKLRSREEAE